MIPFSENPRMTRCQRCQKGIERAFVTFGTPLDCASRSSRLLPQCGMEAYPGRGSTTSPGHVDPHPAELFEHCAGAINLLGCGELGPVPTVNGAGRVAIAYIALADTLQQRSRTLHRRVLGGRVEP